MASNEASPNDGPNDTPVGSVIDLPILQEGYADLR